MNEENNERLLLQKAKSGDKDAFVSLIKAHQARVYAVAFRLLGNREDTAQVCQEVFLQAYQKVLWFRGDSSLYTWLYRLTVNSCYKFFRDHRTDPLFKTVPVEGIEFGGESKSLPANMDFASMSPLKEIELKEKISMVRRAVAGLPKKYYQVIILKDLQGHSYREVSQTLKISEGTVMSRLHRARMLLARQLSRFGGKELL